MSKRVHYCDGDNSYDIIRLYDGEEDKPFAKVYNAAKIENKLFFREWKPEFQNSLSLYPWPKDSYAIMFSGGFDSLSLALRHLEKGERVVLLSVGFSEERTTSSLTVKLLKSIYNNSMKCHIFDKEYPPLKFPLTKVSHEENLEYVASIEKKYQIIFPALSSEGLACDKFVDGNDNILYTIRGGINSNKPNKMILF